MICSYCGTENKTKTCSFCGADLMAKRPKLRGYVSLEQCELPMPELATFHTYDLLMLLKLVREDRTKIYKYMQVLKKGPEEVYVDSDTISFAESEYRRLTARQKVIEGILIDRMGYKPKRVDDKLLMALKKKIEGDKKIE